MSERRVATVVRDDRSKRGGRERRRMALYTHLTIHSSGRTEREVYDRLQYLSITEITTTQSIPGLDEVKMWNRYCRIEFASTFPWLDLTISPVASTAGPNDWHETTGKPCRFVTNWRSFRSRPGQWTSLVRRLPSTHVFGHPFVRSLEVQVLQSIRCGRHAKLHLGQYDIAHYDTGRSDTVQYRTQGRRLGLSSKSRDPRR